MHPEIGGAVGAGSPPPPPSGGGGGSAADTTPPETTITAGPKPKARQLFATFEFGSSEPNSDFQCSFDDNALEACTSPEELKAGKGKHTYEMRATDGSGNTDPTPASQSWTVKKNGKEN